MIRRKIIEPLENLSGFLSLLDKLLDRLKLLILESLIIEPRALKIKKRFNLKQILQCKKNISALNIVFI